MKLTKLYRDTAKVADVASVANSGSIVIYTHSVRDEEEICDGIVSVVNAHERLRITLGLVTETIEAVRPLLSLDTSPRGAELVRLLDVVIGESKAVLALAEKGEGT